MDPCASVFGDAETVCTPCGRQNCRVFIYSIREIWLIRNISADHAYIDTESNQNTFAGHFVFRADESHVPEIVTSSNLSGRTESMRANVSSDLEILVLSTYSSVAGRLLPTPYL
jgi:hypothetical protein